MLDKAKRKLLEAGIKQALICDAYYLKYLCGKQFYAGERFLALFLATEKESVLFVPEILPDAEVEEVRTVRLPDEADGAGEVEKLIDKGSKLGIDGKMKARLLLRLIKDLAAASYEEIDPVLDSLREIKSEEEKDRLRAVSLINDRVITEIRKEIKAGISEKELSERIRSLFERYGYDGNYFAISAFGKNAADPHHIPDETVLKEGDTVLLDIGCRKDDYWSDMTRTYFLGSVDKRQREIYELVKRANEAGEAAVRPGVSFEEVDAAARSVIGEAGYGRYFTHRLGHQVGLELHEGSDVNKGNRALLEPGMVFSCEPGVYIEEEGIGVRIEDLCLVTEDGVEILNKADKELLCL